VALRFPIKRNACHPVLRFRIRRKNDEGVEEAYDLTDALSVYFRMRRPATGREPHPPILIYKPGVLEMPLIAGVVRYNWVSGNLPLAGTFLGEFWVQTATGLLVVPTDEPIHIVVTETL